MRMRRSSHEPSGRSWPHDAHRSRPAGWWLAGAALCLLPWSAAAAPRLTLHGHVPGVVPHLQPTGDVPATQPLDLSIGLPLRQTNELARLLDELTNPASTNYHRFLTPEQFTARFGPTEADYQAVIAFAQTHGLTVVRTQADRHMLHVRAAAGNVASAFQVTLRTYRHPSENRTFYAPDGEPSVDAGLPVADIWGLSDYPRPRPLNTGPRPAGLTVSPSSGSGPSGSLRGSDFRNAYVAGATNLTGLGQTIGLFQADGFYASDITTYESQTGLPQVPIQTVLLDSFSGSPYSANGNGEVSLDIEMTISMAPGMSNLIVYEDNPNSFHPNTVLARMVSDNLARQISSSWSWTGGPTVTTDSYLQNLAALGISYFQASGDDDAYLTGAMDLSTHTNTPVSSPYVTCVGGTTLSMSGSGSAWSSETVWNWNTSGQPGVGSSGGISSYYTIPAWQQGISMAGNQGSTVYRNIPDVAMTADNVYVVYNNGAIGYFGGTSCAAPLWAGFCALVNQQSTSLGYGTVGFLNPALYTIGKGSGYAAAFHDTTTGNNFNTASPAAFSAVSGYDLCTGWGTPNGIALVNALAPPGLHLALLSSQMSDVAGGNGNGAVDPGETIQETLLWTNTTGGVTASNVTATLTTSATGVTLLQATNAYPNIPYLSAASNSTPFSYKLSKSVPAGTILTFTNVLQTGSLAFTGTFSHIVGSVALGAPVTNTFAVTNVVGLAIPQNTTVYITNPVAVAASGSITDVNASVRLNFTRDSWLTIALRHPDATEVILHANTGNTGADFGSGTPPGALVYTVLDDQAATSITSGTAPFSGTYSPSGVLATFNGKAPNGNWVLRLQNTSSTRTGLFYAYQLAITVQSSTYTATVFNLPPVASNQTLTVAAGLATNLVLHGIDGDGDPITFQTNSLPLHGALSAFNTNSGAVTYTATAGYAGTDSFTFVANDGFATSTTATVTLVVTNSLRLLTITANSTNKNYGQTLTFAGTAFTAAGLTNGDSVTNVSLSSAGATSTATVASSPYAIVPTNALGAGLSNYIITYVNGVLTVNKTGQTLSFPTIASQLATNTVHLGATASSGLPVTFAVAAGPAVLNASSNLTFTNAGSVSVSAAQAGDANWNSAASLTNTFIVTRASASVVLSNLTQRYDGTPRVVTATTAPTGLTVVITYNGTTTAPVRVGSYAVTGAINTALYQGSGTGTLVVKAPPQTLILVR